MVWCLSPDEDSDKPEKYFLCSMYHVWYLITFTKEVMFLSALVCLSVCLLATLLTKLLTDFDDIFREGQL